ncbi:hypothetical protein Bca101_085837 [Brassica carinata]
MNKIPSPMMIQLTEGGPHTLQMPTRIKPKAWRFYYDRGLCARLALYCYNLQKGTACDFRFISQLHEQTHLYFTKSFVTFEAVNPADRSPLTFETCVKHNDDQVTHVPNLWWETHICRVEGKKKCLKRYPYRLLMGVALPYYHKFFFVWLKGSEEADYEWNDGAVHDYYKGEMPKWLSDDRQQRCYVVEQSELHDEKNGWLPLLTEFAFFTKWNGPLSPGEIEDCRPLITQHVVVETLDEKEPSDKLNAANAVFYISFECVEDPTIGRYRAVIRKTMDGKPGHMSLEVTCWRFATSTLRGGFSSTFFAGFGYREAVAPSASPSSASASGRRWLPQHRWRRRSF